MGRTARLFLDLPPDSELFDLLRPIPNRLAKLPLACRLTLVSLLLADPAAAAVVVLSNRTTGPVTCSLVEAGQPDKRMTIASGDSQPVFYGSSLRVRYRDGLTQREFRLAAGNAYFFVPGVGDGSLHFERIGLGEGDVSHDEPMPQGVLAVTAPTIAVKLLVDDDEPTHRRIWEPRLRKRLAAASIILERHSGVRLKVEAISTWKSDNSQNDFRLSLREFERKVSPQPARLAIGFSSQYKIARGRVHLGGTRGTLHPYILIKERSPNVRETERVELLVHELGHFLGAAHSPEPQSVMRPVITGGQQRGIGSRVQFDPVNTLLVAMMGDELRHRQVRSLRDVSSTTKNRMLQIYGVLSKALPDDPAASQYQQLIGRSRLGSSTLVKDTRTVLRQIVQVASMRRTQTIGRKPPENGRDGAAAPIGKGDAVTDLYVREAASAAQKIHPKNARKALLLALGIFMDDTATLRTFPATKGVVNLVESDPQRRERLRVMGAPTMRGRGDLAKHFFVSAHINVVMGSQATKGIGLAKEMLDARRGTGFSFADMAANRAGIVFAERLLGGKISLAEVARGFTTEAYLPPVADLREGLGAEQLQEQFGGEGNEALGAELGRIERRVLELPVYNR